MGRARRSWDKLRHLSRENALSIRLGGYAFRVDVCCLRRVRGARWVSRCIPEHMGVFWKLTGGELPRHRLGGDGSYIQCGKGLS